MCIKCLQAPKAEKETQLPFGILFQLHGPNHHHGERHKPEIDKRVWRLRSQKHCGPRHAAPWSQPVPELLEWPALKKLHAHKSKASRTLGCS